MDTEKLRKRLMETFLGELEDRLQSMSRELLALEQKASVATERSRLIPSLLRHAHSLKGAARAVDIRLIEESCHRFEDILGSAQREPDLLNADVFQLLFGTIDGLEEARNRLRSDQGLDGGLLEGISLEMAMYIETMLPVARPENAGAAPPPSEPRVDADTDADFALAQDFELASAEQRPGSAAGSEAGTPPLAEGLSVRIDTEKLDLLLPRSGELLVARQRLRATAERLGALRDTLDRLHADWRLARALLSRLQPGQGHAQAPGQGLAQAQALPQRISELCDNTPARISALTAELEQAQIAFTADWRLLDQAAVSLDEHVRRIRMLPFAHGCAGFDRLVRDLARDAGKEAVLEIEGGDVEIDRSILEGLKDPLRHLIRNAVDHGIEKPNERRQVGKPPCGHIRATAAVRGGQVLVTVSDDGRGLAVDAIRKRAKKMGLPTPESERDIIQAMFVPGFSTAAEAVTLVSGRGIGLDAVKTQLKGLHGEIDVSFTPGQGTRFQLSLPLTLTMLRALLVSVGGTGTGERQIYAISSAHVAKLLRIQPGDVLTVGERPMIVMNGRTVPLLVLSDVLGLPAQPHQRHIGSKQPVVVVSMEERQVAFIVDEILAEQEVMVKSLGSRIQRIPNIAGALILPSGQVALTLHVADLVHTAGSQLHASAVKQLQAAVPESKRRTRRILVVDDSVTTRSLEKSILEAAGFAVDVAKDGQEGWERVQAGDFDLVLSDVDMPRMLGYQMVEAIRRSERFRKLPVILITSHDDATSKERAMRAGASGYIVKGEFDQKVLLQLIEQLI